MRSSKSRSRSKNNRNRNSSLGNVVNRVFDSSGPEGKVRGTPQQIIDKYNQLARDATLGNDRVAAENFQQHAEHYLRMLGEAQREQDQRREQQERENRERQSQRDRERADRAAADAHALRPAALASFVAGAPPLADARRALCGSSQYVRASGRHLELDLRLRLALCALLHHERPFVAAQVRLGRQLRPHNGGDPLLPPIAPVVVVCELLRGSHLR